MKRALCVLLTVIMAMTVLLSSTTALASESGTWGKLTWTLDDSGTLTVSGHGEMDDLDWDPVAWRPYKEIFCSE